MWWRWYYYLSPVGGTLYVLVTSQFGGEQDRLETGETVEHFLRSYFGYRHDFVGFVAIILVGTTVLFGFIFAFSVNVFNFQKR